MNFISMGNQIKNVIMSRINAKIFQENITKITPEHEQDSVIRQMKQTKAHNINENECRVNKQSSIRSIRRTYWWKGPSN